MKDYRVAVVVTVAPERTGLQSVVAFVEVQRGRQGLTAGDCAQRDPIVIFGKTAKGERADPAGQRHRFHPALARNSGHETGNPCHAAVTCLVDAGTGIAVGGKVRLSGSTVQAGRVRGMNRQRSDVLTQQLRPGGEPVVSTVDALPDSARRRPGKQVAIVGIAYKASDAPRVVARPHFLPLHPVRVRIVIDVVPERFQSQRRSVAQRIGGAAEEPVAALFIGIRFLVFTSVGFHRCGVSSGSNLVNDACGAGPPSPAMSRCPGFRPER